MSVYFVLVVLHHVLATGGMAINTWDQQFFYKRIDGSMTVEMKIKKRD